MRARVTEAARRLRLEVEVRELEPPARNCPDAAAAVGCDAQQIAESAVFIADGEPVVCLASGPDRVDVDRVCEALDCAEARLAAADEVLAATGFATEGVPPLAHSLPVLVDERLLAHEWIWSFAGDGHTLFGLDPRALVERAGARVARIAAPGQAGVT